MRSRPLVVLVPVLARPHRVAPVLRSALKATPEARVLFIASPGDEAELAALEAASAEWIEVEGNYARKVNAGIEATTEDYLFTGADDLEFRAGWYEEAQGVARSSCAAVVGTNDLCNPRVISGDHATHFLVARWYVERYGTVDEAGKLLHEGYPHEYVDNELIETAQARGLYAHAPDAIVEHLHPMAGKAPSDELYAAAPARMREGRRVYARRRHLWKALGRGE